MWTTQRFNRGWMGGVWLSGFTPGASAPGVNPALQMRSLALSTFGEFEKERTCLSPKSDFFLAWEIGCVAWERVKTCKSVCHMAKPWELAALVQLSSVDNNYASLNIHHILRHFFSWFGWNTPHNHSPMEQYQTHTLTRIMSMTTSG